MKKKITALCLCVALLAVAVVGASLAYFTDETGTVENVFTLGDVKIDIREVFDEDNAVLVPGKDINKDVFVKNTGSQPAYVRVHIAIPANVDDGDPEFKAINNFLHFNFTNESVAAGQWSWIPKMTNGVGYLGNGADNWNYYTTTVGGVEYAVYVVTYRTALAPNTETATAALDKVYLDKSVDATQNADGSITYKDNKGHEVTFEKGGELKILVKAEAVQTEGFNDAYTALNTAFGTPGSTGYVSPFNK